MAQQPVNHGSIPGDGQGESLFSAFAKVNDNDAELFVAKTEFVANFAALPVTGEAGKIYVTLDDDAMYRWTGTGYDDLGGIQFVANAAALPATGEALKIYVALDTGILYLWLGSAYQALTFGVATNGSGNTVLMAAGGIALLEFLSPGVFAQISAGTTGANTDNATPDITATNVVISNQKTKGSTDASILWIGNNLSGGNCDLELTAAPGKTEAVSVVPGFKLLADINWVQGFYIHNSFVTDGTPRNLAATYGMFIQQPGFAADVTVGSSYGIRIQPQKQTGDIITNVYGIYINGQDPDGNSNAWGLWSDARCYAYGLTIGGDRKIYIGGATNTDAMIQQVGAKLNFYKGDGSGRLDVECAAITSYAKSLRIVTSQTPASASAAGTAGQIAWDANYIYTCVAPNTWKRSPLTTW